MYIIGKKMKTRIFTFCKRAQEVEWSMIYNGAGLKEGAEKTGYSHRRLMKLRIISC